MNILEKLKEIWVDFKNNWDLSTEQQKFALGLGIFSAILFVYFIGVYIPFQTNSNRREIHKASETIAEEQSEAEPVTMNLSSSNFTREKLATYYNTGLWDGSLIRSESGYQVASRDALGHLWLDCYETGTTLDPVLPESYSEYTTVILDGAAINNPHYGNKILRYDFETKEEETLLEGGVYGLLKKVALDTVRFIWYEYDEEGNLEMYHLMEVGATGPVEEIGKSAHPIAIRAFNDYPEEGDAAEFWLLRKAYTSGKWYGNAKPISEIAKAMDIDLAKKPEKEVQNWRNPDLEQLDYSNVDPESIARVDWRDKIIIDNVEKYYLHATKAWLYDDIEYRKIKNISSHGFVEIENSRDFWGYNNQPVAESPTCWISYAARGNDLENEANYDLATAAITLPYYDAYSRNRELEEPEDFLQNLEILEARNWENGLRAVALGYCNTSDLDDPEAHYAVYLSRHNSRFQPIVENAVSLVFLGEYNSDHLNGNYDAPYYDTINLTVYGRERVAFYEDIFEYANAPQMFEYLNFKSSG